MATTTTTLQATNEIDLKSSVPITSKSAPHHVTTTLNFFKDNEDGSLPAPTYVGKTQPAPRPKDPHVVTITDVAGEEEKFNLDTHGFQFVKHQSAEKDFLDEEKIKGAYYEEVDQLIKKVTGATRTFIFDHTIRRPNPNLSPSLRRGPYYSVHIDQSYTAALSRVPHHLPQDASRLLNSRVQILNIWRPIKPIRRDPLAVAAAYSVAEKDLVPIGLIYPDRKGETLGVRYSEGQEWYYKYGQGPEEVLVIKCFDSKEEGGVARRVPHSAFEIEGTEGEEGRESIEVRCLVFYEDQPSGKGE